MRHADSGGKQDADNYPIVKGSMCSKPLHDNLRLSLR